MTPLLVPPPSTVPAPRVYKHFLEGVWSVSNIQSGSRSTDDVIMSCDSQGTTGHVTTEAHCPPSLTSPLPSAAGFFTRAVQKLSSSCRRRLPVRFSGGSRGTPQVPPGLLRCGMKEEVSIVRSLLHRHSSEGEHASSSQGSSAGVVPQGSRNHHSCEVPCTSTPPSSQSFHRGTHRVFIRTNLNIRKMNHEDELVSTLSSGSSQRPSAVSIISSFSQDHQDHHRDHQDHHRDHQDHHRDHQDHHQDLQPPPPSPQIELSDQRRSGRSFSGNKQRHTASFKAKVRTASRGVSDTSSRGVSDTASRGVSDTASRGVSDTASRGVSDTASRGVSDTASRGVSDTASRGVSDTASRGVSETTSRGGVRDRKCPPQQEVSVQSVRTLRDDPRGTKAGVAPPERSRTPAPTGTRAGRGTIMGTLRLQKAPPSPYTKLTAPRRPQRCSSDSSSVLSGELPPAMGRSALFYSSLRTSPAPTPRAHRSPRRRGRGRSPPLTDHNVSSVSVWFSGVLRARVAPKVRGQQVDSDWTRGRCDVML